MFCCFFEIFYSGSGRNPSEQFFFSPILGLSQPILARKEATMVFSNFLNFFAVFSKFSIPGRLETHWNDFFFFFSLSWPFPTYFGLKDDSVFWFFEFYCYFFGIFYYESGRNTSERFFFLSISAFPNLFWLRKKLWLCFLIFWIFLLFFWNFLFRDG